MFIVNTLAPVFAVIALGFVLRKAGFVTDAILGGINRLVYWVGLPALLFLKTSQAEDVSAGSQAIALVLAGTAGCVLVGYAVAWLWRMPGPQAGTFVQAGYRGNLAYVGLAVITLAWGDTSEQVSAGVLALAVTVPVYNILGVTVLLAGQHHFSWSAIGKVLVKIAQNPLLIACVAGLSFSVTGWSLPTVVSDTGRLVGGFTLPGALLGIGGTLAATKLGEHLGKSVAAAAIKLLVAPAVGLGVAWLAGIGGAQLAAAMVMLAAPTAVASYVLTQQLEGDAPMAAGAIVVSTVMSAGSLAAALALAP